MKKLYILFVVIGFAIVGCSQDPKNELSELITEDGSETQTEININSKTKINGLALKDAKEIDIFKRAVSNSKKEPGIVNMANPQYQFSIGEETYFLWITEESGTIMNTKNMHTVYTLSNSSINEIYEYVNKNQSNNIETEGSYLAVLFVNGEVLQANGETANELELVAGEFIDTVKEKIEIEKWPTVELTSNYLREGTEIYSVEGNPKIVLAKKKNGEYEVFK